METAAIVLVFVLAVGIFLFLRRRPKLPGPTEPEKVAPRAGAASAPVPEPPPKVATEAPQEDRSHTAAQSSPKEDPKGEPEPEHVVEEAPASLRVATRAEGPLVPKEAHEGRDQEVAALKKGLTGTRGGFVARLAELFRGASKVDQDLLDQAEALLLSADVGPATAAVVLQSLRDAASTGKLEDEDAVWRRLVELATRTLSIEAPPFGSAPASPLVVLVVGVNGVGKTTTIGKLASRYQREGKSVLLAAGDTFRAAAVLQLEVWGRRVGCPVVKGREGADPGSVIFDAIKRAKAEGVDVIIADTAGRLHTKVPLMDELKKVSRTVVKALERPADEVLLVLDATTGQNATQQAQMFRDAMDVTGVALTKLDGTAKGGVVLGIVTEHRLPIRFIGLGERVEDLREFDAAAFAEALFSRPETETN